MGATTGRQRLISQRPPTIVMGRIEWKCNHACRHLGDCYGSLEPPERDGLQLLVQGSVGLSYSTGSAGFATREPARARLLHLRAATLAQRFGEAGDERGEGVSPDPLSLTGCHL
jgi:hypothetical protein